MGRIRGGRGIGRSGQGLTEYLILMVLVAVVSMAAAKSLGGTIKRKIQMARQHIEHDVSLEDGDGPDSG